jgi:hypothetical protein
VVLDPFRIGFCYIVGHTKCHKEVQNELMTCPRCGGNLPPLVRQEDGPVRLGSDITLALQTLDSLGDRHMAHTKPFRQVYGSSFAGLRNERFNQLDIVFRVLPTMVVASPLESIC